MVFCICLVIAVYFAYTAGSGAFRTRQLSREEALAQAQLQQLREDAAYLEGVRAYVSSDAYVEQEARRKLGYVREGETAFIVVSPPLEEATRAPARWWERLFPR